MENEWNIHEAGGHAMKQSNLVIGANGHLGNNLTRRLLETGRTVRASVRGPSARGPLEGLPCGVVYADIMDRDSLVKAMEGVDTVYACAAVYRSWARDIQREIIDVNIRGTENVVEAAADRGVKKVVSVSSTFTCDHHRTPTDEAGFSDDRTEPYVYSKTEAEKLALDLSGKRGLDLVSIVPSAMIGPHCYGHLTPTMELLAKILANRLPVDPGFRMNFVDIRDVCDAMIAASRVGRAGERYLVAQELPITSTDLLQFAHSLYPSVKIPRRAPYPLLYAASALMELAGAIARREPLMTRAQVKNFREGSSRYNSAKARNELGFSPRPTLDALKDALDYLWLR
jgi:dihydroflavonol-4-reductase